MPLNKDEIKLVLFDIGGVLIEYENVFKTASKDLNIPVSIFNSTFDKYDRDVTVGKISAQDLYDNSLKDNNLSSDVTYNFLNSWINDFTSIGATYNLIMDLNGKYEIGLFSNIYKDMIPKLIEIKLLPDIKYAYQFISADIGMQKPEENIYQYILEKTNLKPSQILYIDDKKDYLNPAIRLNWNVFHFNRYNPEESVDKLRSVLLN